MGKDYVNVTVGEAESLIISGIVFILRVGGRLTLDAKTTYIPQKNPLISRIKSVHRNRH